MRTLFLVALVALAACRYNNADQKWGLYPDADGDGYTANVDCNDHNAAIHPGATETCDGQDDNCNGQIDDNAVDATTWYVDHDGDGYAADGAASVTACTQPTGYADQLGDCNDNDKTIHPGAIDTPDDGIDQDCNGFDTVTCWVDNDGDGYGDLNTTVLNPDGACDASQHQADNHSDCDDTHATVYPGAPELCDGLQNDCANWASPTDPGTLPADELDGDGDGYVPCTFADGVTADNWGHTQDPAVVGGGDCNDADKTIYPDAPELCDGKVNKCGGTLPADEIDGDGDGYVPCTFAAGVTADNWANVQDPPVVGGGDCNDADVTIYPSAPELCDGKVNDCGGTLPADELDGDGDGYVPCTFAAGVTADNWGNVQDPPVIGDKDCDDSSSVTYPRTAVTRPDPWVAPAAGETYEPASGCYKDADNDGFGAMTGLADGVAAGTDCNDTDNTIRPFAVGTVGDAIDQNCDGQLTCYEDADSDGHGTVAGTTVLVDAVVATVPQTCDQPGNHASTVDDDCDDTHNTVFPGAPELCDGLQNNCNNWNGPGDPGTLPTTEQDRDGDGYVPCTFADGVTPATWGDVSVSLDGDQDCDDDPTDPLAVVTFPRTVATSPNPGTPPTKGETYETSPGCYTDFDDDGYGAMTDAQKAANADQGTDCNDTEATIYPGAVELCDGLQNDCSNWSGGTPNALDEGGTVSLQKADGTWVDETSDWSGSTVTVSAPGTHWVCDGIYNITPTVTGDGVIIRGRNGAATTVIDGTRGGNNAPGILIDSTGAVTLRGLKVRNGQAAAATGTGGAVDIRGGGATTVSHCVLRDSTAPGGNRGGLVYLDGGTLTITASTLTNGVADSGGEGGDVYINSGTVTIDATSTVENGGAAYGAGIFVHKASGKVTDVTVQGTVQGNQVTAGGTGQGGGIYLEGGTLTLSSASFDSNTADLDGGALFVQSGSTLSDIGSVFTANGAVHGGAIYVQGGTVNLSNTRIGPVDDTTPLEANTASQQGGGLYLSNNTDTPSTPTLTQVQINYNTAPNGAGIYQSGGTLRTTSTDLTGNTASQAGGGVYQEDGTSINYRLTADSNVAQGGSGTGGGGVAIAYGSFSCDTCTVSNNEAHATGNSGDDGGGVLVDTNHSATAAVTFTNSYVFGNSADDKGGGFRCRGDCDIQITDTLVHDNTGNASGAIELGAGTFTCISDRSGAGAVYHNTAQSQSATLDPPPSGAARINHNGSHVYSYSCDWGTPDVDDNSPVDIGYSGGSQNYGTNASFDCAYDGCTSPPPPL